MGDGGFCRFSSGIFSLMLLGAGTGLFSIVLGKEAYFSVCSRFCSVLLSKDGREESSATVEEFLLVLG